MESGVAPAAALGFGVRNGGSWAFCVGAAGQTPNGPVTAETLFDLASVTKPFVAATFASLAATHVVSRERTLDGLVPETAGTLAGRATLELLFSHRAGLAAHRKLYEPLVALRPFARDAALRHAANASGPPRNPDGSFAALYSDLGYLLAGVAMERAAGKPLDELVRLHVTEPLGLDVASARQWLAADRAFLRRVAPTENVPFRGGLLRGVVHDENAWAWAGHGIAGHAGLFGTVRAVLAFGAAMLDGLAGQSTAWLSREALEPLVAERPSGTLRLGFDGKSGPDSSAGPTASAATFGHLGFTGTSFWCDPRAESVTVLLTNRVCPTRDNLRIRAARPRVHDALFQAAGRIRGGFRRQ